MIANPDQQPVVLVVDDSPDSLGMLHTALHQAGYVVLVALHGQQAIDIISRITPDVILLDAVMPVLDGFAACEQIRRELPLTPILFMTGLGADADIVRAFSSGGTDYLQKPIRPAELLARIGTHLQAARMLAGARNALDIARQFVLAVNTSGGTRWYTPETGDLLRGHGFDPDATAGPLSAAIAAWLPHHRQRGDLILSTPHRPLTLRYFKLAASDEHLLRLVIGDLLRDPALLERVLPLTHREAEVLLWVAHGRTNKEIGEILAMSPRTVNKHLEQLFPKLQVENRAAATAIAIQALLGLPI